jgi:hypothetical protein
LAWLQAEEVLSLLVSRWTVPTSDPDLDPRTFAGLRETVAYKLISEGSIAGRIRDALRDHGDEAFRLAWHEGVTIFG